MTRYKVFDKDIETFFDAPHGSDVWVGLDLGRPVNIGKIRFFPRTNENRIHTGDRYMLYYWDGGQWQLLNEQVATGYLLHFQAPNAMYYLHNVTSNQKGDYFVIIDGEQKWY